jgi:hypothetical protein
MPCRHPGVRLMQEYLGVRALCVERLLQQRFRRSKRAMRLRNFVTACAANGLSFAHGPAIDNAGNVSCLMRGRRTARATWSSNPGPSIAASGHAWNARQSSWLFCAARAALGLAPNADISVADWPKHRDRRVKFATDGKFITAGASVARQPANSIRLTASHAIRPGVSTSPTAPTTASKFSIRTPRSRRSACRFGRPSDSAIDKTGMIYNADSRSTATKTQSFGVRIGSAKDGKVTAFSRGRRPRPERRKMSGWMMPEKS